MSEKETVAEGPSAPQCPKCGSRKVRGILERGRPYTTGCALLGCLLFGPLGLLWGMLASDPDKFKLACLSCGHRFLPPRTRQAQWLRMILTLGLILALVVLLLAIVC